MTRPSDDAPDMDKTRERPPLSVADREKRSVALSSLLAAILLTGTKLGVGLWTNSLGILSEAAHSGLDLVAAAMTLWAVQVSGRPADREHPYGHGKIENLSALFETVLLLVTCFWIISEAVKRLFFAEELVDLDGVERSDWQRLKLGVTERYPLIWSDLPSAHGVRSTDLTMFRTPRLHLGLRQALPMQEIGARSPWVRREAEVDWNGDQSELDRALPH